MRLLLLLPVLSLLFLSACTSEGSTESPPSAQQIPIYLGGTRPDVVDKAPQSELRWLHINYSVADPPHAVLLFYDDVLSQDGWRSLETPDKSANRRFRWSSTSFGLVYSLSVDTQVKNGQTAITMEFREEARP